MRRHELELIAALAEGSLDDETEARALIESSPRYRAEYEAQRAAIEALRDTPVARLTEHERSALHRDVWTVLRTPAAEPKRNPWYYRWSYVTAGLLLVTVGLAAVLSQQGDDTGTAALDLATGESADDGAEGGEQPDTRETVAAAAPTFTEEDAAGDEAGRVLSDPTLSMFNDVAGKARAGTLASGLATQDSTPYSFAREQADCLTQAGLEGYDVLAEVTLDGVDEAGLDSDTPYLVAVPSNAELSTSTPVAFVALETCEHVYTAG